MNSLIEIANKCYLTLKYEIHFKFFTYIFKNAKNMNIVQRAKEFSATNI
jgi:hypothetical protein